MMNGLFLCGQLKTSIVIDKIGNFH